MLASIFFLILGGSITHAEKITASVIDVAPIGYVEGAEQKGLYVEILQALAAAGSFEVEIQLTPYLRAISLVESKEIDLTIMFDTEISDKIKTKKVKLYERNLNIYTLKEGSFSSGQDFSGEIGRLTGACSDLEKNRQIKLVNLGSFDQGLNLLVKNRLRGICGTHASIHFVCHKLRRPIRQLKGTLIAKKMLSAHFHPTASREKVEKVMKAFQIIQQNGQLQKIRDKYHDADT